MPDLFPVVIEVPYSRLCNHSCTESSCLLVSLCGSFMSNKNYSSSDNSNIHNKYNNRTSALELDIAKINNRWSEQGGLVLPDCNSFHHRAVPITGGAFSVWYFIIMSLCFRIFYFGYRAVEPLFINNGIKTTEADHGKNVGTFPINVESRIWNQVTSVHTRSLTHRATVPPVQINCYIQKLYKPSICRFIKSYGSTSYRYIKSMKG